MSGRGASLNSSMLHLVSCWDVKTWYFSCLALHVLTLESCCLIQELSWTMTHLLSWSVLCPGVKLLLRNEFHFWTVSTLCTLFNQESSRQLRIHSIPKSLPGKAPLITRIRYPKNLQCFRRWSSSSELGFKNWLTRVRLGHTMLQDVSCCCCAKYTS
jgi:hypothetical protein